MSDFNVDLIKPMRYQMNERGLFLDAIKQAQKIKMKEKLIDEQISKVTPTKYQMYLPSYSYSSKTDILVGKSTKAKRDTNSCNKCNRNCGSSYWHKDFSVFLCQPCWLEEYKIGGIFGWTELRHFKKNKFI